MTADRIKEIQEETGLAQSISVYLALLKVWNECMQEQSKDLVTMDDALGFAKFCKHHSHPNFEITEESLNIYLKQKQ